MSVSAFERRWGRTIRCTSVASPSRATTSRSRSRRSAVIAQGRRRRFTGTPSAGRWSRRWGGRTTTTTGCRYRPPRCSRSAGCSRRARCATRCRRHCRRALRRTMYQRLTCGRERSARSLPRCPMCQRSIPFSRPRGRSRTAFITIMTDASPAATSRNMIAAPAPRVTGCVSSARAWTRRCCPRRRQRPLRRSSRTDRFALPATVRRKPDPHQWGH